jgi:soluble lytic murein transglycosylase-like protein
LRTHRQLAVVALLLSLGPLAHAGERVTLSNGFAMECHHHAQLNGRVRLYTSAGDTSYIELKSEEVVQFEEIPDPPANRAPIDSQPSNTDTRLRPAELHEVLSTAGHAHNLDVDLLASVVNAESRGDAHAVSRAGARGLMQLMPSTASDLGVQDSFQPDENVRGGSTYLDALLTRYHENLALALAAYNAGPAAVARYHGIPPYHETRAYVARVIREFNRRVRAREAQKQRTGNSMARNTN